MLKSTLRRILRHFYLFVAYESVQREKEIQSDLDGISRTIRGHHALLPLQPSTYIPTSSFSLSTSAIITIVNDILINRRNTIVELGTGVSTFYIGKLLQQMDHGHIYSIENDKKWFTTYNQLIERENLTAWITLIHAPLEDYSRDEKGQTPWYDCSTLRTAISSPKIDMLIVDGPWRGLGHIARYPALPFFFNSLGNDYFILLDDIEKPDDKETLQLWEKEFGVKFKQIDNFAIATDGTDIIRL